MRTDMDDEQAAWKRKREQTITDTVDLMLELFVDTPWMSATKHRRIPKKVMLRAHKQIRYATALGGVALELRTWVSEMQIACGDQGQSWIKNFPWKGNRIRHVQLLEMTYSDDQMGYKVLWTSPNVYVDPHTMPH